MAMLKMRPGMPKDPLGSWMNGRIRELKIANNRARKTAAATATSATQGKFVRRRRADRPDHPPRMSQAMTWKDNSARGMVEFDVDRANAAAPYWIIQEIGTGSRARVLKPGRTGRGRTRNENLRTVKSQVGRRVRTTMAFGTGPGGRYLRPMGYGTDQLYRARDLTNVPWPRARIVIKREIPAQNMVQTGGRAGFRQYRDEVLTVARKTFRGFPFRA